MPADGGITLQTRTQPAASPPHRRRFGSPLLRRILLVNAVPLVLLVAALLYLDQYQNGLLGAEVLTLREQARIYAGAFGEAAVRQFGDNPPTLVPELARPLLRRLTEPTPNADAKLYGPDGSLIAGSRPPGKDDKPEKLLPPVVANGALIGFVGKFYDWVLGHMPHSGQETVIDTSPNAAGIDWQPDVKQEFGSKSDSVPEMPPYIRRTASNRLLVTVAEPVQHDKHTVGIVQLTRDAREVEASLFEVRMSILALFFLALGLTVIMSAYLARTIARPLRRLAVAAEQVQEGHGRSGSVPQRLQRRRDEIGELASALAASAQALWQRMDAIEQFAADVAHEIKNPLSSIRSAIETLRRIEDSRQQKRLLAIIADDVIRLDRLISDISDASRIDAELSRATTEPVDITPILAVLTEMHETTRAEGEPHIVLDAPDGPLVVQAVEDRLVQVLRNLIGNARSFSPRNGRILLRARPGNGMVEISVEDEGPGIPEAKLEHVFDRFYTERPQTEQFGKHSGLGLSISRQIVEALKGGIGAENRRDDSGRVIGARFVVKLPRGNPARPHKADDQPVLTR